jgi:hypothetical protein
MNLHPRGEHYDIVQCSKRKPRVKVQIGVGYWVCFGTRGIVLCKSRDAEIVQDAAVVFNAGEKHNAGVGGKKGYIYWSSSDFLIQG